MYTKLLTRSDAGLGVGLFDSIAWAFDEHVMDIPKGVIATDFKSAVMHCVNEDSPSMIEFYTQAEPTVTDKPAYTWHDPMSELRHVRLDGYTLQTWDTGYMDGNKTRIRYEFKTPEGKVLFSGDDFRCSPMHADDSDECLRALLGFLTLKPGDTDRDYFANYTPDQMDFAQGDAEMLSLYAMDGEGYLFTNLDDFEGGE